MSAGQPTWICAARRTDLAEGQAIGVEIAGRQIAIYDCDGVLYATDNICTHAYARLCDGWLDGTAIECPLHSARFDVRTGKALDPPATEDVQTYPVRLRDGDIEIEIETDQP